MNISHGLLDSSGSNPHRTLRERAPAQRAKGQQRTSFARRGRYSMTTGERREGARIALDATLRRASVSQVTCHEAGDLMLRVRATDLLFKRFRRKTGALYIFAIDTSGSMALNRIGHAKGAALQLLRKSYINRDRIALVSFRARAAETILGPSNSQGRAARILEALPVGGATPLASALQHSLDIARRSKAAGAGRTVLVLFTDGRGNVPLANKIKGGTSNASVSVNSEITSALFHGQTHASPATVAKNIFRNQIEAEIEELGGALQRAGVFSVVVDTMSSFTSKGEGKFVAGALGGRYVQLPQSPNWKDCIGLLHP